MPVAMPKMIMNKAASSMMITIRAMIVTPLCITLASHPGIIRTFRQAPVANPA